MLEVTPTSELEWQGLTKNRIGVSPQIVPSPLPFFAANVRPLAALSLASPSPARFRLGLRGRCWSWTAEQPKPTNKAVPNFEWVGLDAKLGI